MSTLFTARLQQPDTHPPRRLRLLVADDHPINLQYMAILLEKMGHEATFCENGQEALQRLAQQPFDAVLLDYHMPVLDGLATTEAIRELDFPASQIQVILVTADVENDTRKRARAVGVNAFTSKPLQAQDLQGALACCGLLDEPVPSSQGMSMRFSGGSPLSTNERPVHLPELPDQASHLIDTESYAEIVSMMPRESLDELLKTVFDPPEGTVHVLLQALADGDREAVGYNAHKLKGTAMLMGFRALVKSSAQLEQWAAQTEQPLHISLGAQLRRDAEQTQKAVRQLALSEPA